jgi:hypothetical protein
MDKSYHIFSKSPSLSRNLATHNRIVRHEKAREKASWRDEARNKESPESTQNAAPSSCHLVYGQTALRLLSQQPRICGVVELSTETSCEGWGFLMLKKRGLHDE